MSEDSLQLPEDASDGATEIPSFAKDDSRLECWISDGEVSFSETGESGVSADSDVDAIEVACFSSSSIALCRDRNVRRED